jgi:hypothetical protein
MSATSELIAEKLRLVNEQIKEAQLKRLDTRDLEELKEDLNKKLLAATAALSESRTILKG